MVFYNVCKFPIFIFHCEISQNKENVSLEMFGIWSINRDIRHPHLLGLQCSVLKNIFFNRLMFG